MAKFHDKPSLAFAGLPPRPLLGTYYSPAALTPCPGPRRSRGSHPHRVGGTKAHGPPRLSLHGAQGVCSRKLGDEPGAAPWHRSEPRLPAAVLGSPKARPSTRLCVPRPHARPPPPPGRSGLHSSMVFCASFSARTSSVSYLIFAPPPRYFWGFFALFSPQREHPHGKGLCLAGKTSLFL